MDRLKQIESFVAVATRGSLNAYQVKVGSTLDYVALSSGGWRTTRTDQTFGEACSA